MNATEFTFEQSSEESVQQRYFDSTRNRYARSAVLEPPLHTACEYQRVVDRLDAAQIDGPVIDFGAGTGRLSIALARAGYSVLAVDVSERPVAELSDASRRHDQGTASRCADG